MMEFLVHMEVARIEGGEEREKQLREQEAARSRELAKQGLLVRFGEYREGGRTGASGEPTMRPAAQCFCLPAAVLRI